MKGKFIKSPSNYCFYLDRVAYSANFRSNLRVNWRELQDSQALQNLR